MSTFRVRDWRINLSAGWIERSSLFRRHRIYPDTRLTALLSVLIANAGSLVPTERLLAEAWPDRVVSRDSVATAIYELRKLLGDDASAPTYILTETRRGYRLIAGVEMNSERSRHWYLASSAASVMLLIGMITISNFGESSSPQQPPEVETQLQLPANTDARRHDLRFCPANTKREKRLTS